MLPWLVAGLCVSVTAALWIERWSSTRRLAPPYVSVILVIGLLLPCVGSLRLAREEARLLRRWRQGLCPRCGYSLTGNASGTCPECGTPTPAKAKT